MKKLCIAILSILVLFPSFVSADSPLTSTDFYQAYIEMDVVKDARKSGVMNEDFAEYLSSTNEDVTLDKKAAVINALGWDFNGKQNAKLYTQYLKEKYNSGTNELSYEKLTDDEVFCIGYLKALDDYFNVTDARKILKIVVDERGSLSFTAHIVYAMVRAQEAMDSDWSKIWPLVEEVIDNDKLKKVMRPEAVEIILEYMRLYK